MSTKTTEIDWWAVTPVRPGARHQHAPARRLHDAERAITWALQMSREHNGVASLSYYELAAMLGHRDAKVTTRAHHDWNALLREAEQLRAAVKVKVSAEQAEAEKAKAEADKAKADAEKTEADKQAKAKPETVGGKEGHDE
jgi:hypothetical protein